eukprot:1101528-Amphidinium_carterae.2
MTVVLDDSADLSEKHHRLDGEFLQSASTPVLCTELSSSVRVLEARMKFSTFKGSHDAGKGGGFDGVRSVVSKQCALRAWHPTQVVEAASNSKELLTAECTEVLGAGARDIT